MNSFLTQYPTVAILLNPEGKVEAIASNIAPIGELTVIFTTDPAAFREEAANKPFNSQLSVN